MRAFQAASAAFCLACICAELVTLLVGSQWAHRCIKTLAGLYILVVLLQLLPSARAELGRLTAAQAAPVELPGLEAQIVSQTQARLEETLQAECLAQFGVAAELEVGLEQSGQELQVQRAVVTLPAGCSAEDAQKVSAYLRQQLGTEPELRFKEEADE